MINLFTALMFTLFTVYQSILIAETDASRVGGLFELLTFVFIIIASVFSLIPKPAFRIIRALLLVAGLLLNIIIKLVNIPVIFGNLDFSDTVSVLNCAVYVFAQTAELLLLVYYLFFRLNDRLCLKRAVAIAMMSFVILLYISCLIMECVLLLKYRSGVESGDSYTLISIFLYFFGYISIAVSFMLPVRITEHSDDIINQLPGEDDLKFSPPDKDRVVLSVPEKLVPDGDDFKFSAPGKDKAKNNKPVIPASYGEDLKFSPDEKDRAVLEKPDLSARYAEDIKFIPSEKKRSSSKKPGKPVPYGEDFKFVVKEKEKPHLKKKKNQKNQTKQVSAEVDKDFIL